MRAGAIIAAGLVGAFLGAPEAWACFSYDHTESSVEKGPGCAIRYEDKGESDFQGLDKVEKLGNGFVVQRYFETSCVNNSMVLVTDCKSGRMLVVGYGQTGPDYMVSDPVEVEPIIAAVKAGVARGKTLEELRPGPGKWDQGTIASMRNGLRLSIGYIKPRHSFNLRCGCETSYPDQIGDWEKQWKN